jgi:hypothetical protein
MGAALDGNALGRLAAKEALGRRRHRVAARSDGIGLGRRGLHLDQRRQQFGHLRARRHARMMALKPFIVAD